MSIATETPEPGRIGRLSSLDFAYWVMSTATDYWGRDSGISNFMGRPEDEQDSVDVVVNSASQCGVSLPAEFDGLMNLCLGRQISTREAHHTRGSLLFRNRGVAMALGDRTRIVECRDGRVIVRFMTMDELHPSFWLAALIPGMEYL